MGKNKGQKETMMLRAEDGTMREFEIVSTRERESVFQAACPVLPLPVAIVCCILNFIPGLGTWVAAWAQICCHRFHKRPENFAARICLCLLAAVLQLLLAPVVIGFIWSIRYGVQLIHKARDGQQPENNEDSEEEP